MNANWRNRPTSIDYIPRSIDYVIGFDESGNADLKHLSKMLANGRNFDNNDRHFTVTACSIAIQDFVSARERIMALKHKYWKDALFNYNGNQKRVCFHSREIRNRNNAFRQDCIDHDAFILELSALLASVPITLFASHIDKLSHIQQYTHPKSPYNLCMTFVLERVIYSINNSDKCIIVLEARGKKEDNELLDFIKRLIDHGSDYCPASSFDCIKGVYFNPKWCSAADEKMSYWLLELADLYAYPIQKFFVHGKRDRAFETLLPKIKGFPEIMGKGLKSFP